MKRQKIMVAVVGGHSCDEDTARIAQKLGREIAKLGVVLVCGGLGGVMEAVAKGAKQADGLTVGILPSENKEDANPYIDIPVATGLGYTRNTLVVGTADIIVALEGEYGTLSEISFALNMKKPVIGLGSWDVKGVMQVDSVGAAIKLIEEIVYLYVAA